MAEVFIQIEQGSKGSESNNLLVDLKKGEKKAFTRIFQIYNSRLSHFAKADFIGKLNFLDFDIPVPNFGSMVLKRNMSFIEFPIIGEIGPFTTVAQLGPFF